MGVVLVFSGQSLNNAITFTIERDVECLKALGHSVIVADMTTSPALPNPSELDLIVGYQAWGHDVKLPSGEAYVQAADCPFVVVLGDHPIHHAARILACPANTVFCVGSNNQSAFLRNVLNVQSDVYLLPAGMVADQRTGIEARDLGVVFIGQLTNPDTYLASQNLPPVLTEIIREFVECAANDPTIDVITDYMHRGYERVLNIVGNQPSAISVGRLIDHVARYQFRWKFVQALRSSPITFVGDDWVNLERQSDDRFQALPSALFNELPSIYARAQICLNLHPPYYDFHERIVDAMTQSTAVATAPTSCLKEVFEFGTNILALPTHAEEAPAWLEGLLKDPAYLEAVGAAGHSLAVERFKASAPSDLFHKVLEAKQKLRTAGVA